MSTDAHVPQTEMSAPPAAPTRRQTRSSRGLVLGVLFLTLGVLVLGGAVLVVKLKPSHSAPSVQDQQLSAAEAAAQADPKSADAQTVLGMALLDQGRTGDAKAAFEDAIRLNENAWMAKFQLALLIRQTNAERAVALFSDAAKAAPHADRAVVLVGLGDFQLERGNAGAALKAYRNSIADVPYLFDSHYGAAQAYEKLGQNKQAIAEYKEALRFAPDDPGIKAAIHRLNTEK